MPKRDDAYMAEQRERIADAAMEVMLEKGAYETSVRDICQAAGVSRGALYVHFPTRDDIVLAGFQRANIGGAGFSPTSTWQDFIGHFEKAWEALTDERARGVLSLSYQFAAHQLREPTILPGMAMIRTQYESWARESLTALRDAGEITLPLGVEATMNAHAALINGAIYQLVLTNSPPDPASRAETLNILAILAGRKKIEDFAS